MRLGFGMIVLLSNGFLNWPFVVVFFAGGMSLMAVLSCVAASFSCFTCVFVLALIGFPVCSTAGCFAPKNRLPAKNSSFEMTESISTSLPPIDNVEPGSRGVVQLVLPMPLPETSWR